MVVFNCFFCWETLVATPALHLQPSSVGLIRACCGCHDGDCKLRRGHQHLAKQTGVMEMRQVRGLNDAAEAYVGGRDPYVGAYVLRVRYAGAAVDMLDMEPSLATWYKSPAGFEWGYGGSGPSQLSLALLLDVTDDSKLAATRFQDFKRAVVARLPDEGWQIKAESIRGVAPNRSGR